MPPMASFPVKRKWSDLLDEDVNERQMLMELCAAKLRYVNPPRPPKRRTEVPLLRSVLIVNAMKHLSSEMKIENYVDSPAEDLSVDPGHFEGLPPLSELLTDIMLDPQPSPADQCYQQQSIASNFNWTSTSSPHYSPITPVQPTLPSYLEAESFMDTTDEEKTVHNLLPCTSVINTDDSQHSTRSAWEQQASILDILSEASSSHSSSDSMSFSSEFTFQPPRNPLPSFTSLFDSTISSQPYSDLSQPSSPHYSTPPTTSSPSLLPSTSTVNFPFSNNFPTPEDIMGNTNFSESDLEILAKTFSVKLPAISIEEFVHALPQTSFSQPTPSTQSPFHVPSALHSSNTNLDSNLSTSNQCASYCRNDQPPPNVDDGSMVRVLVNL